MGELGVIAKYAENIDHAFDPGSAKLDVHLKEAPACHMPQFFNTQPKFLTVG